MKLISYALAAFLMYSTLYAFQAHDQNLAYTHPSIVVSNGVSYISVQDVPSGTTISSTAYWTTLVNTAPSDDPGDPPTSDPDDSNFSNLTPPEDNSSIAPSGLLSATNQQFVMQQYRDFFGRDADEGGLNWWTGELDAGRKVRGDLSLDFVYSNEFQNNVAPVVRLYFAYFNRLPDTGGLTFWISSYTDGSYTLNQISDAFAGSNEFATTYGSLDNAGFVNLIYANLFNRSPDQGGYDYWLGQLDSSAITRGAAMVGYSESDEYKQLMNNRVSIVSYYYGMLRRAPDQGGFDYWVQRLDDGDSAIDLVNGFLYSDEYQGRDFTLTH
jgi:hypothetical protein